MRDECGSDELVFSITRAQKLDENEILLLSYSYGGRSVTLFDIVYRRRAAEGEKGQGTDHLCAVYFYLFIVIFFHVIQNRFFFLVALPMSIASETRAHTSSPPLSRI